MKLLCFIVVLGCTIRIGQVECWSSSAGAAPSRRTNVVPRLAEPISSRWSARLSSTTSVQLAMSTSNEAWSESQQQQQQQQSAENVHTLILCRHGDSIWNGGEPGCQETFTGWTDVPLSQKGIEEAKNTGRQVSSYTLGIDACFTSVLQRAQLTAHYCLWAFAEKPCGMEPRKYICDYRLNERHYGSLQGFVKRDVENGKYGHDPRDVKLWRRSWHTVPPLLHDDDPRRVAEVRKFGNYCHDASVPRGESLEQVARNRIDPFLEEVLTPVLDAAQGNNGTGLIVAHANSLRALIGVICDAESDPRALAKLEALRIQTGVPLVLKYLRRADGTYCVCDLDGIPYPTRADAAAATTTTGAATEGDTEGVPDLPVFPLSAVPMNAAKVVDGSNLSVQMDFGRRSGDNSSGACTSVATASAENSGARQANGHQQTKRMMDTESSAACNVRS